MRSPMLLPLPPRLASSSTVTLIFIILSCISLIPHFAHATDADSIAHDDHNHPRIRDLQDQSGVSETLGLMQEEGSLSYEPTFAGLDRSILGRAPEKIPLKMNTRNTRNITKGETHIWTVQSPSDARSLARASLSHGERENGNSHELLKREQDGRMMNLTLSICDIENASNNVPPALYLNISSNSATIATISGFLNTSTFLEQNSDVDLSVFVDESADFEGTYNYELTASTDVLDTGLTFIDNDNNSTLLLASVLYRNQSSLPQDTSYGIFVYPNDTLISSIKNSTCAVKKLAQIKGILSNFTTGKTNLSGEPKTLFHITGLNRSTSYWATMVIDGNSSQGPAGDHFEVFRPINFQTKSNTNCAVIYNLSFCTDTAYAVPYSPYSNLNLSSLAPSTDIQAYNTNPYPNPDLSSLASFYDIQAFLLYRNFTFSRQQIPCNTTSSAQYSLARNCTHCDEAYKSWLCAVTIPRCQDFSARDNWLMPRSVSQPFLNGTMLNMDDPALNVSNKTYKLMNSSRNPSIDLFIKPGPWKEVLPCEDLCYRLVQSCPAALGFACPTGKWLDYSYGKRQSDNMMCNDPDFPPWKPSAAGREVSTNILGALAAFGLILVLQLGGC